MRLIISMVFSLGTVFGLLLLMSNLIAAKATHDVQSIPSDYGDLEYDRSLLEKIRKPPEQKPVVEKPEQPETVTAPPTRSDKVKPLESNLPTDFTSKIAFNKPTLENITFALPGENQQEGDATPSLRIEPLYPREALLEGTEGSVSLAFDIDETGRVINIRVIESKPNRVFDKAAVNALRKWKYQAKIEGWQPVSVRNQSVTLQFKMES